MNRYTYVTRQIGDHRVLIAYHPLQITHDDPCEFNGKLYPRKSMLWMDSFYIEIDEPVGFLIKITKFGMLHSVKALPSFG